MSPRPDLRVVGQSAAASAHSAIAEAKAQTAAALQDALAALQEGATRAIEVCAVCPPHLIGYGAHERLRRLAAHIDSELRQLEALEHK